MDTEKLTSLACRALFGITLLTLLIGALEKLFNLFGVKVLPYTPERILDITVAFSMFILVLLVRQIRQEVKIRNRGS